MLDIAFLSLLVQSFVEIEGKQRSSQVQHVREAYLWIMVLPVNLFPTGPGKK